MTTQRDIVAYRQVMADLSTVAVAQVAGLLGSIDLSGDPVAIRDTLLAAVPEVVQPYVSASGDVAATWYEDLRSAAVGGSFYATSSGEINRQQMAASIRWAVAPLFGQSDSTVLSLLGGTAQRLVTDAGRNTVRDNALRDRARVGFARIPRPGCCAFCGMLAARGAVYTSEATSSGSHYHDHCHCVGAPVFTGDTFHHETQAEFASIYDEARQLTGPHGRVDTKATLAAMRQQGDIK